MPIDKASTLERGQVIPDFTSQSISGETVSSRSFYMRRNYVIALLPESIDDSWLEWLNSLRRSVNSIPAADGNVICLVVASSSSDLTAGSFEPEDRFQILMDIDGTAADRFNHDRQTGMLIVADRYGVIFHTAAGGPAHAGMDPDEVPGWIELIACRCS